MNKILTFLKSSNHYKHIICGLIIFLIFSPINIYGALYATFASAGSLEFKDKMYGAKFDIIDVLCMVTLPSIITLIYYIISLF